MQRSIERFYHNDREWIIETRDYIPSKERLYQGEDTIADQVTPFIEVNLIHRGFILLTKKVIPELEKKAITDLKYYVEHSYDQERI